MSSPTNMSSSWAKDARDEKAGFFTVRFFLTVRCGYGAVFHTVRCGSVRLTAPHRIVGFCPPTNNRSRGTK